VFTPYWRAWTQAPRRSIRPGPGSFRLPDGLDPGGLPAVGSTVGTGEAGDLFPGGETAAQRQLGRWTLEAARYDGLRDMLAVDGTSGLSPYLHFGCLSPLSAVRTVASAAGPAGEAFIRQLCWRDFFHQVLAAFPGLGRSAYRTGAVESWRDDADALAGWREGRTGIPIVDAGMRQLAAEGFMHNRARLITAAFLTKSLRLDWRHGARWYAELLVDADVANNAGNWQWVAGTGTDTKPFRRFNPVRQAQRFDPDGAYVRRWVPELAGIPGPAVHKPWLLPGGQRRRLGYERPLVLATEVS
jgi:deoxyribodipyrimidine photo-lyase